MPDRPLLKPRALRPGDRVAVIAPASPFPRDEFDAGIGELRALGFDPVFAPSVFDRRRYLAGTAAARAEALMAAWQDPAIKAIFTARGGYGSVHLLPFLSPEMMRQSPTLLVGYSDITALLAFVTTRCRIATLHGPTVAGRLGRGTAAYDRASLLQALTGIGPTTRLVAGAMETIAAGDASGPVCGGNLTQLAASLGTPYAFSPPDGCILFLEDVNERPYRIDRLLTQLRQSGVLGRARALLFGQMPGCDEPDGQITAREVVADFASDFGGPVAWGLPSGHTAEAALTVPFGVCGRVRADESGASFEMLESAVVDPGD
ncbi:MAG: LD-carboxypeptidase [Acidobacteria bacterium]|nr:LD-carboxypeptidase [Acidobacteriota bacterium]